MSVVAGTLGWLASCVGAVGGAAAVATHPVLLVPVLMIVTPLAVLLLLIPILVGVALYSADANRQERAEKILERLLSTLPSGRQSADDDPASTGPVR